MFSIYIYSILVFLRITLNIYMLMFHKFTHTHTHTLLFISVCALLSFSFLKGLLANVSAHKCKQGKTARFIIRLRAEQSFCFLPTCHLEADLSARIMTSAISDMEEEWRGFGEDITSGGIPFHDPSMGFLARLGCHRDTDCGGLCCFFSPLCMSLWGVYIKICLI